MSKTITEQLLKGFARDFAADRANLVAQNAVIANGIAKAAENYQAVRQDIPVYSVSLDQPGITNQKQSGRCWMFAGMNFLRYQVIRRLQLEDFELSQTYPLFFDKLEKANWFLENILETLDEPTGSRVLDFLLAAPLGDGGQWDMLRDLIKKYGVVPQSAMPETASSSATRALDNYLTKKLREDACRLRQAQGAGLAGLRSMKQEMLATIYRMLCISLGNPPVSFTFEYTDKKKKFHRDADLTPKQFYAKYIGLDLDDYISVINAPTSDKPFHRSYTVRYLGNVKEGAGVRYLNLPAADLKALAIKQLQDGTPVWFGSDVGQFSSREGLMDLEAYRLDRLFNTEFGLTKAERLDYGESRMTHAMVLQGVNLDSRGRPNRWRVENSWGKEAGKDGYFLMTDDWFSEYAYQVVINKKYLSAGQLKEYESKPRVLDPWDPMGSLAK